MFFTANKNIILSYNLSGTRYQVSGSSDCSALIKAGDESGYKSKSQGLFLFPWPELSQKKVYIFSSYTVGHNSPDTSE